MTARDTLTKNQLCVLEKLEAASGPLSAYMLLVHFSGLSLPALLPLAVVMLALHWRYFQYSRSEVFALLYAAARTMVAEDPSEWIPVLEALEEHRQDPTFRAHLANVAVMEKGIARGVKPGEEINLLALPASARLPDELASLVNA